MIPIVILSYKRAHKIAKNGGTLYALNKELHEHVTLVVRAEEAEQYAEHGCKLDVLPPEVKDIAGTRQYIWDKYSHLPYFCQLDDDIHYFNQTLRRNDDPSLPYTRKPDQFWYCPILRSREQQEKMFADLVAELQKGVGMTSPRPNWTFPDGSDRCFPVTHASFVTGFYLFNCDLLRPINLRFDFGNSTGDADAVFQVLAHGIDCTYRTDYKYNIDLPGNHDPNSEVHARQMEEYPLLVQKWTPYIKLRKPSKRFNYGYASTGLGSIMQHRAKCLKDAPLADPLR